MLKFGLLVGAPLIYASYKLYCYLTAPDPELALVANTPKPPPQDNMPLSPSLEENLLAVCDKFKGFASADATTFLPSICLYSYLDHPTHSNFAIPYVNEIKNRINTLSYTQMSALQQSAVPVLLSNISREQLLKSVKFVMQAHGGACTNFAMAAAGSIINSYNESGEQEPHIEVIAYVNGRSSHLFVLVNRGPNTDLHDSDSWNDDCYIVDAWAMSMGYSSGVINNTFYNYGDGVYRWGDRNHPDTKKHYPFISMVKNIERKFDNFKENMPSQHKLKRL